MWASVDWGKLLSSNDFILYLHNTCFIVTTFKGVKLYILKSTLHIHYSLEKHINVLHHFLN